MSAPSQREAQQPKETDYSNYLQWLVQHRENRGAAAGGAGQAGGGTSNLGNALAKGMGLSGGAGAGALASL